MAKVKTGVEDQMSAWLEAHVRPHIEMMRREFLWEYLSIYQSWYDEIVQSHAVDDQIILERLVFHAEESLRSIAHGKPARLLLHAIRTLPLAVVDYISPLPERISRTELLRTASLASCLFGKQDNEQTSKENGIAVEARWLEEFLSSLAIDLAHFFGASYTRLHARSWYRIIGKGGKLKRPEDPELKRARKALDSLRPGSILIVPTITFVNEADILPQVIDYDERCQQSGSDSGLLRERNIGNVTNTDRPMWWFVSATPPKKTQVLAIHYPLQNVTFVTKSYMFQARPLQDELSFVAPYGTLFGSRVGIAYDAFERLCRSVDAIIRNETGILTLKTVINTEQVTTFVSQHRNRTAEQSSSQFLYSVTARGLLRAPKTAWLRELTRLNKKGGATDPQREAESFLEVFTRKHTLDHDLEPSLFLEVGPNMIVLDLLMTPNFFELCIRKATAIDDAPRKAPRRGVQFELFTWDFLRRTLNVKPAVPLNKKFQDGSEKGEIDIAFFKDDILVVLECKSWQKRIDYLRGDRRAIQRRHDDLQSILSTQVRRNVSFLLKHFSGSATTRAVLSFVCVASPEFIMKEHAQLWYGSIPRVVTPFELVSLITDAPRWDMAIGSALATDFL